MKTLCITGISEPDLLQIGRLFNQAGMVQPHSIERSPGLNIKEWHTRFWGNAEEGTPPENQPSPGKFGEQLAGEIFLANMDTPLWGWQDSRSAWLLDFWADFDPRLVFVLVCFPLDYQLARRMEAQSLQPLNVDEVVTAWKDFHGQLLQFYHRFPERCQLVGVDDCSTQFEALAQSCQAKWNLPLVVDSDGNHKQFSTPDPLFRHLAKDFLHNQPEVTGLWNELAATLTSFSSQEDTSLELSDVVASLHGLGDRSLEEGQIVTLGQLNSDLRHQLNTLSSHNQKTEHTLTALEGGFAQLTKEREGLKATNADLTASVDKLAKQGEQQQDQIKRLTQERDTLKTNLTTHVQQLGSIKEQYRETNEENELLLLQLHQVQEDLESIFLEKMEAEKRWHTEGEELRRANADLTAALEELTEKTEARWQRLKQRQPGYHDYQSLTVAPGPKPSSLTWQISNLEIDSRHFSDLQVETFLLAGVTGFRFTRPGEDTGEDSVYETSTLLRWPWEVQDALQVDLIPVAERRQDVQRRINTLNGLTASDWHMLQPLARFLKARLQDRELEADLPVSLGKATMEGLDRFIEVIKNFPPSLRYDCINLEKEDYSEDCERLQLSIENLSHGELQCSRFEFCLSCAGLHSSEFGSHPRLEFPANTSSVLRGWFDSSDDPEDPRLELRFAMPDAMDLDVWRKLSEEDAGFILMLVQQLPQMLDGLRDSDPGFNRSWDDWLSLAYDIEQILKLHTAPPEPEEAA